MSRIESRATCTTSSVSGRGINTRGSTNTSRCRNDQRCITYCRGSPNNRRRTISRNAAPQRSLTSSDKPDLNSLVSNPLACSQSHRASCSLPRSSKVFSNNSPHVIVSSLYTTEIISRRRKPTARSDTQVSTHRSLGLSCQPKLLATDAE